MTTSFGYIMRLTSPAVWNVPKMDRARHASLQDLIMT